jgi:hypothetical protein
VSAAKASSETLGNAPAFAPREQPLREIWNADEAFEPLESDSDGIATNGKTLHQDLRCLRPSPKDYSSRDCWMKHY